MNRLFLFFLLAMGSFAAVAQPVKCKWNSDPKKNAVREASEIVGRDKTGIYVYGQDATETSVIITKFDNELNLLYSTKNKLKSLDGKKGYLSDVVLLGDRVYALIRHYAKDKTGLYAYAADETGTLSTTPQKIADLPGEDEWSWPTELTIRITPDHQSLAAVWARNFRRSKKGGFVFTAVDKNLKQINRGEYKPKRALKYFSMEQILHLNGGKTYLACNEIIDGGSKYTVYDYGQPSTDGSSENETYELSMEEGIYTSISLRMEAANKLGCYFTYSKSEDLGIAGISKTVIDLTNGDKKEQEIAFGKKELDVLMRKDEQKKGKAPSDYLMREWIPMKDGKSIVLCERKVTFVDESDEIKWWTCEDYIAIGIDATGKVDWIHRVPRRKSAFIDPVLLNYITPLASADGAKVTFYYMDYKEQAPLSANLTKQPMFQNPTTFVRTSFTLDGRMKREVLVPTGNSDVEPDFDTREPRANGECVLLGEIKGKKTVGIVTIP